MLDIVASFDLGLEQALYALRTPSLVKLFSVLTELGGALAIIAITLALVGVLYRQGRWDYIVGLCVSLAGGIGSGYIIKHLIARARPSAPYPAVIETGYSFPSNHSIAAVALYGFLAYVVWQMYEKDSTRGLWVSFLAALIILIGFSRLYLGVHYFSDVIAGYALGFVFAYFGILVARRLARSKSSSAVQNSF